MSTPFKVRQRILAALFEFFKEYPYAEMELARIAELCDIDAKTLNWNIVYLEKCGFVELGRSHDCPPFVSCAACLTAKGIDIIEDEDAFRSKFRNKE